MRNRAARVAAQAEMSDLQKEALKAEIRKTLADAFKAITQGQKNTAAADAETTNTALDILERGTDDGSEGTSGAS
jgi:hypothetical protein